MYDKSEAFRQYLKDTDTSEPSEARAFMAGYAQGRLAANTILLKELQLAEAHRDLANARYDALVVTVRELRAELAGIKGCTL